METPPNANKTEPDIRKLLFDIVVKAVADSETNEQFSLMNMSPYDTAADQIIQIMGEDQTYPTTIANLLRGCGQLPSDEDSIRNLMSQNLIAMSNSPFQPPTPLDQNHPIVQAFNTRVQDPNNQDTLKVIGKIKNAYENETVNRQVINNRLNLDNAI